MIPSYPRLHSLTQILPPNTYNIEFYLTNLLEVFLIDFIFYNSIRFTEKLSRKYRVIIYSLSLHPVSPIINILHQFGTFVTSNKPILIHY